MFCPMTAATGSLNISTNDGASGQPCVMPCLQAKPWRNPMVGLEAQDELSNSIQDSVETQ